MFWLQPFITAFTGWFTIWIAIYMLFHPRNPKRFLWITIQGIFPKQQKQIAAKLGSIVAKELINFSEFATRLNDTVELKKLTPTIEKHLDNFLEVKLKERLPVLSVFIGASMLQNIKEGMLEEIELLLPELISQYTGSLSKKIDIEKMVSDKVAGFSSDKLEEIIQSIMKKELRYIEIMGAALGFVIGLIQMGLSLL